MQFGGGLRDARRGGRRRWRRVPTRRCSAPPRLRDPELVGGLAAEHGERIVVGVDARRGQVAVEGWERETRAGAAESVSELAARGVRRFVFTPVEVDGTLAGPGLEQLQAVAHAAADAGAALIYSGGVGSLDDLRELASEPRSRAWRA